MSIIFERLEGNDLPLPSYATSMAAGIDLAACLTRPCTLIKADQKKLFYNRDTGGRYDVVPNVIDKPKLNIAPGETVLVPIGYKCQFQSDMVMLLCIRSSLSMKGLMLTNGVGIIDADYRGELMACLFNRGGTSISIFHGDRIVQAVMTKLSTLSISEGSLTTTERGEGGFGSTGA